MAAINAAKAVYTVIYKIAFLSAQIPNVEQVSTQTPVYIFPDDDSIEAATPPASSYTPFLKLPYTYHSIRTYVCKRANSGNMGRIWGGGISGCLWRETISSTSKSISTSISL